MACSESSYIQDCTTLEERLVRLDNIIDALEIRALDSVSDSSTDEYSIDDGQIKIKTKYRSHKAILDAIVGFNRLKYKIINDMNGRKVILRPCN